MRHLLILVLSLLAGCTMIDIQSSLPADWPILQERVSYGADAIRATGCPFNPVLFSTGCANINFDTGICTIAILSDDEYGALTLEHEREHCKGRDHAGSTALADYWATWKAKH